MAKNLIAFYSRADENYVSGMLKNLTIGNTEVAAGILQQLTGADLFKIEQVQPYAKGYNQCIAQAQEDQKRDARPELKAYPESMIPFILVSPITGVPCPWQFLLFWNTLISAEKPSNLFAHMKAAAWDRAKEILKDYVPMQMWKKVLQFMEAV